MPHPFNLRGFMAKPITNDTREKSARDNGYKPVLFFSQSEKLMVGNPELQQEERFTSGQIAREEAIIRFAGHFYTAHTQQEYDLLMRLYPPKQSDKGTIPNRFVFPVDENFQAKYEKAQYEKRQNLRKPRETKESSFEPEEMVKNFD